MYELEDLEQKVYNLNQRKLFKQLALIANHNDTKHQVHIKLFEKGSFLVKEKQAIKGYYFVLDGKIKVYNTGANHKIQILKLACKGDIIGLSGFNSTHYWASAIAEDNVTTYFISQDNFNDFLCSHHELAILLIKSLAFKVRHYEIRQKHLSLFPATERIVDSLLLISNKFGVKTSKGIMLRHCVSRKDISSFSGVSLENTIRTLRKLKEKGYINISPGIIVIENQKALINIVKNYCCPNSHHSKDICYIG